MEVSFTLWSMQDVLKGIPFGAPAGEAVHLDFSNMAVPHYVKNGFKVSIFFVDDSFPVDASCSIYSPKKTESSMAIPLISKEKPGDSPSVFDKDHFRYKDDDLNYFRLYEELMLDYDTKGNTQSRF